VLNPAGVEFQFVKTPETYAGQNQQRNSGKNGRCSGDAPSSVPYKALFLHCNGARQIIEDTNHFPEPSGFDRENKYPVWGYLSNPLNYLCLMSKTIFSVGQEKLQVLLIEARRKAELSQVQLAKKLGRPQSFVSKYENGERRLDVVELREICHALEITLPVFINRFEKVLQS
jgi:DNA-binding XRE family transcriptional regulator